MSDKVIVVHRCREGYIHIHVAAADDPDRWDHVGDPNDEITMEDEDKVPARVEKLKAKYNAPVEESAE